jgi:hypothetical protein
VVLDRGKAGYHPGRSMRLEGIVGMSNEYGGAEQRQRGDYGFQHDASLSSLGKRHSRDSFQDFTARLNGFVIDCGLRRRFKIEPSGYNMFWR